MAIARGAPHAPFLYVARQLGPKETLFKFIDCFSDTAVTTDRRTVGQLEDLLLSSMRDNSAELDAGAVFGEILNSHNAINVRQLVESSPVILQITGKTIHLLIKG